MTEDENLCAERVRQLDPLRFLSAMAAPPEQRAALMILYAFNLEVARAPWASKEEVLAEMRLQWWLDQVGEIYENGKVSAHMVMTPLAELVQRHALPRAVLEAMITARRWDIYREPFADRAAFEKFIQDTAGGLLRLSCQVLDPPEMPDAEALAAHAHARGVAAMLLAVPDYRNRGRIPFPEMRLAEIQKLAQIAYISSKNSKNMLKKYHKPALYALRSGWWAPAVLKRAATEPDRVFSGTLMASPFRLRLGLIWKTTYGGF